MGLTRKERVAERGSGPTRLFRVRQRSLSRRDLNHHLPAGIRPNLVPGSPPTGEVRVSAQGVVLRRGLIAEATIAFGS